MAKMSNSLVKQFAKTITQSVPQEKSKSSDALGTLVKEGNIFYAMLDGSTFLTPVSMSMSGEEGDRVLVTIQNHSAIVTSNITAPGATTKYVERVEADLTTFKDVTVKNLLANYIRTDELEAKVGTFGYLKIETAEATYLKTVELEAKVGTFGYLKSEQLESEVAKFGYLKTGELAADIAKLGYLKVTDAEATYLKVDELEGKVGTFGYLKVSELEGAVGKFGYLTADQASLKYAQIDFANVTGQVVGTSLIKDGAITDAKILGLSANKITAGILDAAKITVTNLNADNITVGTLNGKLIGTGSVDLNKLAEEVPTKEYLDSVQNGLQGQIDKSIQTYTVTAIPLLNNEPAQSWATEEYPKHVGDVCYVVNPGGQADGYTYRFEKDGDTYGWSLIKDSQVTEALQKLLNVDGDLSGLKSFKSETSSWITKTDSELSSVKSRTTTIETTYSTKAEAKNLAEDAKNGAIDEAAKDATSKANKAKTDAINAAASDATSKANSAKSEAISAAASDATSKANSALDNAKKYADDAVDGIEIGGRNWLPNTGNKFAYCQCGSGITSENLDNGIIKVNCTADNKNWVSTNASISPELIKNTFKKGDILTFSIDIKCDSGSTGVPDIYWFDSNGYYALNPRIVTDKWTRFTVTKTYCSIDDTMTDTTMHLGMIHCVGTFYFKLPKLEKGTKATDWTPAPEDIDQALSTKVETTIFNEVKQTVDTNSAQITQMNQTIAQKADGSTVESLQQTVNKVQQTATENVSKISQVTQSVERAQSTADDANSKIDGLEIGGRNLALNSADLTKWSIESGMKIEKEGDWFKVTSVSQTSERWGIYLDVPVEKNTIYTFSVYGKTGSVAAYCGGGPITNGFGQYWGPIPSESRIVETLSTEDKTVWRIYLNIFPTAVGQYTYFKLPKLEKGTKATDWTPAPEDMATQESVEKVSSTVNEVKQTADSNSAQITQMNQTIAQKADGSKVTELEERTSLVEQNLSGFKSEVSSTYTTKTEFENLEIGGRNLLEQTRTFSNPWALNGTISSNVMIDDDGYAYTSVIRTWGDYIYQYRKLDVGIYTISFYAKADTPVTLEIKDDSKNNISFSNVIISDKTWTRYIVSFNVAKIDYTPKISFLTRQDTTQIYIKAIKLEKGTKATDWTPAPEDMTAEAQDYATAAKNEAISAAASDATSKVNKGIKQATSIAANDAASKANQALSNAINDTKQRLEKYVTTTTYNSYVQQTDSKIAAKLESSTFNSFQDGEYSNFKKSTNEFIGTSEAWEMKWNKIFNGTNAAEDTYQSYITFQNGEQILGNSKSSIKLHLKNDTIQFEDSNGNALASFDAANIYLGKNSSTSVIDLCNGLGKIRNESPASGYNGLTIIGTDQTVIKSRYVVNINTIADTDNDWYGSKIELSTNDTPWYGDTSNGGSITLTCRGGKHVGTMYLTEGELMFSIDDGSNTGFLQITNAENRVTLCGNQIHLAGKTYPEQGIFLPSNGTWWVGGKTATNCIVACQQTTGSYHPVLRINSASGYVWNIGGINNEIGFYGFKASRADNDNGVDFYTRWDMDSWNLIHSGYFEAHGEIRSGSHVTVTTCGSVGQFRALHGNYGFIIRNDGSDTYFLLTNSGDPWGSWSGLRPLTIHNANGYVTIGTGCSLQAQGGARIYGNGGHDSQITLSSGGNLVCLNRAGNENSFHGNLGSGTNYWNTVNYKNLNKVSDRRKKRNLGKLSLDETLLLLNNIQTVKYSMIDESEDAVQYGVFAQDIRDMLRINNLGYRSMLNISFIDGSEQMTTNLYASEDSVTYGVDYIQFIAPLIKGWQYHNDELEETKQNYQALQGQYQSLQGQIEALRNKLYELEMVM